MSNFYIRKQVEYVTLGLTVVSLCLLVWLHREFVAQSTLWVTIGDCLKPQLQIPPQANVLRIRVVSSIELLSMLNLQPERSEQIYVYSFNKGLALYVNFPSSTSDQLPIDSITLLTTNSCFPASFIGILVHYVIGWDTVLSNILIQIHKGRGYLYNTETTQMFNLNYASEFFTKMKSWPTFIAYKVGILLAIIFLFLTITSLVSYTVRETQRRMLDFSVLLSHRIRNRLPCLPIVASHFIDSLVFVPIMGGLLFFLAECFQDRFIAYSILAMVWIGELFSIISARTRISILYFPRLFFCAFALFHVYFFSFPFGFTYAALFTTLMFCIYLLLHFYNEYEIPAYAQGQVSTGIPRQLSLQVIDAYAMDSPVSSSIG